MQICKLLRTGNLFVCDCGVVPFETEEVLAAFLVDSAGEETAIAVVDIVVFYQPVSA